MQRVQSSDRSKVGTPAWLLRTLPRGQGASWTLVGLLVVGLLRVAPLYAESRSVTATLILQVREAGQIELQNDSVIVKLRLTRGVAANLWSDKACSVPAYASYIITASGTYSIPLDEINQRQNSEAADISFICLQSSDGVLHSSLPANSGAVGTGKSTSVTKTPSKLIWSGRVSISAARVSSAKNASILPARQ